jgi:hypothetical protein
MPGSRSKKKRYSLKSKGKTMLYIERTSSGVVAGVPGAKHPKKPHYTLAKIGKKLDHHIAFDDETRGRIPLGPLSEEDLREVLRFVVGHMIPWDPDFEYWVPTQKLLDSVDLEGPLPPEPKSPEPLQLPDELAHARLDDPTLWKRQKLGQAAAAETGWGIRLGDGIPVVVLVAAGRLCEMTLEEAAGALASPFIKALGFDRLVALLRRKE